MTTREELAATFQIHRSHLFSLAYRMLGSAADAEDVLQDAYLRWQKHGREAVKSPRAFLTTIVTHLCLDLLSSARHQRETYVGPWLPEPVDTGLLEPHDMAGLSLAFLVVLESLSPLERAAFVMREVFDYEFAEIASVLGRDEAAVRKLVQRARAHVAERRPRFAPSREAHGRLLETFLQAIAEGDPRRVEALLAQEVQAAADGGGQISAARNVIRGPNAVARYLLGLAHKGLLGPSGPKGVVVDAQIGDINGSPALLLRHQQKTMGVLEIETDGALIHAVHIIVNPDKLTHAGVQPC